MDEQRSARSSNFTLEVKNFGPIVNASVDLRPLTVFAGPSNTGKSYLAILAYALHKCFGSPRSPRYGRYGEYSLRSRAAPTPIGDVASLGLREWLSDAQEWVFNTPEGNGPTAVPQTVVEPIRTILETAGDLDGYVETEMTRCFGLEHHRELIRRPGSHDGARVTLKVPQTTGEPASGDGETDAARYQFDFTRRRTTADSGKISVSAPIQFRAEYLQDLRENVLRGFNLRPPRARGDIPEPEIENLASYVVDSLFLSLFHPLNASAFYLPASRTGVMHSHQTVVSALIQSATAAGRRPTARVPVLSGVLADFLDEMLALPRRPLQGLRSGTRTRRGMSRSRREFDELAGLLEENLLRGEIDLQRGETEYPIFSYRPYGWKQELPLMRTSSMVSELAPVVLYLRYLVRPGDLFIIEEPESHLHPEMQSAFARELARLVHSGVRVLVTTHSEWFLEQIANLVRLSELPETKRAGIPGADVALRPDDVGAWLFAPKLRPRGSVVEEIGLEQESGLYPVGYEDVSAALYNDSAEIFNRLQEPAE